VTAQQIAAVQIEGVLLIARRMVGGRIERVKVVPDGFDVWAVSDGKAERLENLSDAGGHFANRMLRAESGPLPREGRIEGAAFFWTGGKRGLLFFNQRRQLLLELIGPFSKERLFLVRHILELRHHIGQ